MANTGTMERVYVSSLKAGDCQTLRVPAASGTYQEGQCANWDSGNSRYKLTNVSPEVVVAETVVLANPGTIVVYVPTSRLKGSQLLKVDGTALNPNAALIRSFLQSGIVVEG